MTFNLGAAYQQLCQQQSLRVDQQQQRAVQVLQTFAERLLAARSRWPWRARKLVPGIYLHGGVGCGKTMLMDLFLQNLPAIIKSQRLHFLHFMRLIHQGLQQHRGAPEPLARVVADLGDLHLLAIDEFYVEDIADAMILSRLLDALAAKGISLILTSNCAPDQLYPGGLQRRRFLPAIAKLQSLEAIAFTKVIDYRLLQLGARQRLLVPADTASQRQLSELFTSYAGSGAQAEIMKVNGRDVRCLGRSRELIWFSFADICQSARASSDYLELAQRYSVFMVSDIPIFTGNLDSDNSARRLVALVDELYDQGKTMIVSAAAQPTELYQGHRLASIFARCGSRLIEMTRVKAEASD